MGYDIVHLYLVLPGTWLLHTSQVPPLLPPLRVLYCTVRRATGGESFFTLAFLPLASATSLYALYLYMLSIIHFKLINKNKCPKNNELVQA